VARFVDQALSNRPLTVFGDGTQTRSFTYVSDMVEGILKAAWVTDVSGEVVNLGSTAETILRLTDSDSRIEFHPLPADDPKRRCPDISKAKRLLRWEPKTGLEEGLQRAIAWFRGKAQ